MIEWQCKSFLELSNEELYKIIQLRIEVFSIEQNVVYQDCDNKDVKCFHMTGFDNGELIAYSRIIPPGIAYNGAASIGRVVTSQQVRGKSVGKKLFEKSLEQVYKLFGSIPISISAQAYLVKFYEAFSFVQHGSIYMEDSIPHILMIRVV